MHVLGVSPKDFAMDDLRSLLIGLVGYDFGHEPETKIREIRESRRDFANSIADIAGINSTDVVLDLRSGCGFATYWLAQRAKHIHVCDVNSAYLQFAKNECRDVSNITFHQIEPRSLSPLADNSIDVVCAMSVFIHFNLYDMYWNFQELARVTKPRARVWIDIADSGIHRVRQPECQRKILPQPRKRVQERAWIDIQANAMEFYRCCRKNGIPLWF